MIKIKDLLLTEVSRLDEKLGFYWRRGYLEDSGISQGCVNVELLPDTVITGSDDGSFLMLDKNGTKVLLERNAFSEVTFV